MALKAIAQKQSSEQSISKVQFKKVTVQKSMWNSEQLFPIKPLSSSLLICVSIKLLRKAIP